MSRNILVPGYLRWDGTKFTTDPDVTIVFPSPITAWTSFTPGFNSVGLDASLGNGVTSGYWRKVYDSLEIQQIINIGSSTSFGTGNFMMNLPLPQSQMRIDTAKCLFGTGSTGGDDRFHILGQTGNLSGGKGAVTIGGSLVCTTDTITISSILYDSLQVPFGDFYGTFGVGLVNPDMLTLNIAIPIII